ncbi:MAG TPA: molecular chaperone DnaJ [Actinomycetota bacterium]|jgi:molecular chaperone DnaJ
MATLPDLYAVLGVGHDATDDEIRRAYRRLARELHPDVNGDPEAERRFKEVSAAYETLSDPGRRQQYDLFGQSGGIGMGAGSPFGDFGDLFEVFFGGGLGGRRRSRRRPTRVRNGDDVAVALELSFEEAVFGVEKEATLDLLAECSRCDGSGCEPGTSTSACSRCGGTGEIQDMARSIFGTVVTARPCPVCDATGEIVSSPCATCAGDGRTPERRTIPIGVPAGVTHGTDLRLNGVGNAGRAGGAPGDVYVSLRVRPHEIFARRGQDLFATMVVPMTQAALGAEVEAQTMDGIERIRLEAGVESGTTLRLRGKGVPNLGRRGRGDLFLTILVETPRPGSREERRLLERLAELRSERPQKGTPQAARLRRPDGE